MIIDLSNYTLDEDLGDESIISWSNNDVSDNS